MRRPRDQKPNDTALRRRAVVKLGKGGARVPGTSNADSAHLVHELQVHQVELELQNEELRRARGDLEAALARVTELYDFAPVGYLTLDPRGIICEANLRAASLLERERGALLGLELGALLAAESREAFNAFLQATLASCGRRSCDVLLRRQGGASPLQLEGMPADEGAPVGRRCRVAVLDVAELRRLEAYARNAAKMAAVALLAAGVAHEVNNPLSYVLEGVSHLEEALAVLQPPRPDLLETAQDCGEGVRRIREVVRSLRFLSNPTLVARIPVDPRKELDAALRLAFNDLRHRAQVVTRLEQTPTVEASPHELGRVFLNLLVNAAQAIPEGSAERQSIDVSCGSDREGWAFIEVKDSGQGMAPEVLERVFEPFYSTKPHEVGTGLGLALARGIVNSAGGRIEVVSKPGQGSTFRVCLPPARARPAAGAEVKRVPDAAPPGSQAIAPAQPWRVLVVDDEEKVARAAARSLAVSCAVTVCASGERALEVLASGATFDAVLCDLMMPAMSGPQLQEKVAARWPALATRFVYLTGGAFTSETRAFLARSQCERLEKPFEAADLRATVERVAAAGAGPAQPRREEEPRRRS